jgi:hypothetical protein
VTLDAFAATIAARIPTPAEFVAFADSQGWRIRVKPDGGAGLGAPKTNPLAVQLARILSREPYRSQVLAIVRDRPPPDPEAPPFEAPPAPGEPNPTPAPTHCQQCRAWVNPEVAAGDVRAMCSQSQCPYGAPPKRW